ncbi:MAG: Sua5/YciO/YrdC/YwlC family protein [Actinobacteria bacterium]|nr:Sua5/YciO/YrdC/YwlC family protein [Actinomycetota bacterium]
MTVTAAHARRFEQVIADGGIAVFPTDTLYGIACDPDSTAAAARIYELKGRPSAKPSAVMFFSMERMLTALPELDRRARDVAAELLPGPFTLVVANPRRRFLAACADAPERLGLRVPDLAKGGSAELAAVRLPVMQTSANFSDAPDVTAADQIDPAIREGVDMVLDGGDLPGLGSTVLDVSELERGRWQLLRAPREADAKRAIQAVGSDPA